MAAQEFRLARSWYARRSRPAAERFTEAIGAALEGIAAEPDRWLLYDDRHRWVKARKYPFLLIYRQTAEDRVTVVAVAHASRRPGYWQRRGV